MNGLNKTEQMDMAQHSATQPDYASEVVDSLMNNFNGLLNMTNQFVIFVTEYKKVGYKGVTVDAQKLVNNIQESLEAAKQHMRQNGILPEEAFNADNKEISDAAREIQADLEKKIEGIKGVSQELNKAVPNIVLAQNALIAEGMSR